MKSEGVELNFENDLEIETSNLQKEFKKFAPIMYRYRTMKADAKKAFDLAKGLYEETRAQVYIETKKSGDKVTEKHLEALIETDNRVKKFFLEMIDAKHDLETIEGYVDSLAAKKDMLIQLGADARKE